MEMTVNTFILGSSVVSVWPKKLNIPANSSVKIKVSKGVVTATTGVSQIKKDLALLRRLAGVNKGKFGFTPEELNRRYEVGTYGRIFK